LNFSPVVVVALKRGAGSLALSSPRPFANTPAEKMKTAAKISRQSQMRAQPGGEYTRCRDHARKCNPAANVWQLARQSAGQACNVHKSIITALVAPSGLVQALPLGGQ
jgi:hypothetical protein